jgi:hypothetical protein
MTDYWVGAKGGRLGIETLLGSLYLYRPAFVALSRNRIAVFTGIEARTPPGSFKWERARPSALIRTDPDCGEEGRGRIVPTLSIHVEEISEASSLLRHGVARVPCLDSVIFVTWQFIYNVLFD